MGQARQGMGVSVILAFDVIGLPAPKGSFVRMPNGATVMGTSKTGRRKLVEWERAVADAARAYLADNPQQPITGPFAITIAFRFPPSKSDPYRYWHAIKPDIDKCARLTLDSLKLGGLIGDDCAACKLTASKRFTIGDESPGCTIEIEPLADDEAELREGRKQRAAAARRGPSMEMQALPL